MALLGDTLLRRQHRRRGGLSLRRRRDAHHRAGPQAHRPSSPAGTGRAACCRAPTARKLYVGVGSLSNIGEHGMEAEEGRACIYELDLASGQQPHLRLRPAQPGGLAWEPTHRRAVDRGQRARRPGRRDAARLPDLGADGGFYGWPYCYWGQTVDDRVPQDAGDGRAGASRPTTRSAATPPRSASAGCPPARCPAFPTAWRSASTARGTAARSAATRWSSCRSRTAAQPGRRATSSPASCRRTRRESYGRPVGVAIGPDGALLVADDVGDVIWRVTGRVAAASASRRQVRGVGPGHRFRDELDHGAAPHAVLILVF